MSDQIWSFVVTIIGVIGFWLAGKKVWWAWWLNLANQALWLIFALVTEQYGFLIAVAFYGFIFTKNAISWTKEHNQVQVTREPIGTITSISEDANGLTVTGVLNDQEFIDAIRENPVVIPPGGVENACMYMHWGVHRVDGVRRCRYPHCKGYNPYPRLEESKENRNA